MPVPVRESSYSPLWDNWTRAISNYSGGLDAIRYSPARQGGIHKHYSPQGGV